MSSVVWFWFWSVSNGHKQVLNVITLQFRFSDERCPSSTINNVHKISTKKKELKFSSKRNQNDWTSQPMYFFVPWKRAHPTSDDCGLQWQVVKCASFSLKKLWNSNITNNVLFCSLEKSRSQNWRLWPSVSGRKVRIPQSQKYITINVLFCSLEKSAFHNWRLRPSVSGRKVRIPQSQKAVEFALWTVQVVLQDLLLLKRRTRNYKPLCIWQVRRKTCCFISVDECKQTHSKCNYLSVAKETFVYTYSLFTLGQISSITLRLSLCCFATALFISKNWLRSIRV